MKAQIETHYGGSDNLAARIPHFHRLLKLGRAGMHRGLIGSLGCVTARETEWTTDHDWLARRDANPAEAS